MRGLLLGSITLVLGAFTGTAQATEVERFLTSPRCMEASPASCESLRNLLKHPGKTLSLLEAALDTPVDAHRIRIMRALSHLSPDATLPLFLRIHSRDPSAAVRQVTLRALDKRSRPELLAGVQRLAQSSAPLERVDAAANVREPLGEPGITLLEALIHDPTESVSHAAIRSLGRLEDGPGTALLVDAAFRDGLHESSRHAALSALKNHPLSDVIPRVLLLMGDPSPALRLGAIGLLGAWKASYGHPALIEALQDDATVDAAARVLAALKVRSSAPSILGALEREGLSDTQRHRIISALGSLGEQGSVGPLMNRLHTAPRGESVSIARALGALNSPEAIPTLISLLENSDGAIRDAALGSLESITQERLGRTPHAWRKWAEAAIPETKGDNSGQRRPLHQRSTLGTADPR